MDKISLSDITPYLIAIGGGLAFIAYRQPREFKKLANWLYALVICLFIGGLAWNVSNETAHIAALESDAVATGKIEVLSRAIRVHSLPWWCS